MKEIKLYQIKIKNKPEEFNAFSLFDEQDFYKEFNEYYNYRNFERSVISCIDNFYVKEIKGYYDEKHLFIDTIGYGYELVEKPLQCYTKSGVVESNRCALKVCLTLEDAVKICHNVKMNVEKWLETIREVK